VYHRPDVPVVDHSIVPLAAGVIVPSEIVFEADVCTNIAFTVMLVVPVYVCGFVFPPMPPDHNENEYVELGTAFRYTVCPLGTFSAVTNGYHGPVVPVVDHWIAPLPYVPGVIVLLPADGMNVAFTVTLAF
jgi:hypothetical protein